MTDVNVVPMEPGTFGVHVTEGTMTTSHRVVVPGGMLDDLDLTDVDQEAIVRESIEFLLEREPASSILPEFSLDEIPRYFPEYYEELRLRLER